MVIDVRGSTSPCRGARHVRCVPRGRARLRSRNRRCRLMTARRASGSRQPAGLALFKGEHVTNYGLLMAGSVLTLLPMVVAFLFVQRRFIEGIATTGLK